MSEDVTVGLVRALIQNLKGAPEDWAAFALVLELDGQKVSAVHGFAYSADGAASGAAASPSSIRPAVAAYTDSHYSPEQPLPVALLVQFDRTNGRDEVTFEDTDRGRWKVTPANFSTIRHELRPQFS
ncbi:hypothetical protein CZ771_14370 [Actinomycetales bacterium JB111]|nr:hypothetical protein CZ771_14370 [Actinomycetales bacterium JB111]